MSAERTVMFQLPSVLSGTFACIAGTVAGRSWDLSAGTFVIGRNEGCDLQLPNEAGVSKVHAKIIAEGDSYMIVDCESRNGTIVNGAPVQKQALQDGDEVRICGCVLRFSARGGAAGGIKVRNIDQRDEITDAAAPAPAPPPATVSATQLAIAEPLPYAAPARPARGRVLAVWYAFGLVGSLVFGGTATAVVVFSAEPAQADADAVALIVDPKVAATDPAVPAVPSGPPVAAAVPAAGAAPLPAAVPVDGADAKAADATREGANAADATAEAKAAEAKAAEAKAAEAKADPKAVAEAEKDLASDDEPAVVTPKVERKKRRASIAAAPTASEAAVPDEEEPAGKRSFKATAEGGKSETLRTRGGKVRSVDAKDGEMVSKGQVLVTFDEGENGDEVATLRDRIASLEGAEDEEARRELKAAKAKLDALQGAKSAPLVAGMAGRLSGFTVGAGEVLKNGESIGRVVEGDAPRRVRVTVDRQTKPKRGQEVALVLRRGGEGSGTVLAISGRTVTVDTGELSADEVESVRF